jgi:peptidoglycan/LPS O-acetylase OafA/YrhL
MTAETIMPHHLASTIATQPTTERNLPLGYLRNLVILLVVLHHTLLAYMRFASPVQPSMDASLFWTAFPIVDNQRWAGADLIVGFNDTFFMSLMFLISGVFAWPSLQRKGSGVFLRDRLWRLGLPFVLAAALLAPLAYYPTWLASPTHTGSFWQQWFALGVWPAGPAWFLWVLLAFGVVAALLLLIAPTWGSALGRVAARLGQRPLMFFMALLLVSLLVYLPMAAWFDPSRWLMFGPFFVQISRLPHYFVYFLVGAALGAQGATSGLLASDGRLARRWPLWVLLSLLAFGLSTITVIAIVGTLARGGPSHALATFGNFTYVLSCASASFALLALFTRFARRAHHAMDSLGANAYGIYLLHYVAVIWLQYALLLMPLPALAKIVLVFAGALTFSWGTTAALRRWHAAAQIL